MTRNTRTSAPSSPASWRARPATCRRTWATPSSMAAGRATWGPRTRPAFDLSREDPRTRARYGETDWGKSLLTARRLAEAGVRFVQCQAGFRLRPATGRTTTWDDHSVNADIFKAYDERLPVFD